jgi:hypothetical protein
MKKTATGLLVMGIAVGMVFSQGVSITGKVSDPNGVGLAGTIVRLAISGLETQTNANGYYALGSATVNAQQLLTATTDAYSKPFLSSGKVFFSVNGDNARVRISMHDLDGRFVADVLSRRMNRGNYTVALDGRNLASRPYVLSVNINGSSHAMKFTPVGLRSMQGTAGDNVGSSSRSARLEKAMATNDTIKATKPGYSIGKQPADVSGGTYNFTLTKTSTWNGDTVAFWGNVSTYPTNGIQYVILNRTNGAFPDSKIYWSDQQGGTKIPLSQQSTYKATANGRFYIWIAPNDSSNRYFDFIEVNINGLTWYGNTTQVDGWRLPITFRIHSSDGKDVTLGSIYEMFYQSRKSKYDEFVNEVPKEFIGLGTHDFANIWAPHTSPVNYFNTNGPYANYFTAYQAQVAAAQTGAPAPVSAYNIFACAGGGMGSSPDWSAAINRHVGTIPLPTKRLPNGNVDFSPWYPDSNYYKAAPCNYYSRWCHRRSLRNMCYGFPYDDVGGHAAYLGQSNVQWLAIAIGW